MEKILVWLYIIYMPFGYIMKNVKKFYIDYIWTNNKSLELEEFILNPKFLLCALLICSFVISLLYFSIIWWFCLVCLYYFTYAVFYKM